MSFLWEKLLRPAAFSFDAERVHEFAIHAMRRGAATPFYQSSANLFEAIELSGITFKNPLGVGAGFDKNALVVDQLASLGFGSVEVGTVTARPQPGNPRPRLFRLSDRGALINRMGFNNDGAAVISKRLREIKRQCVVGVNIGRNKDVSNENAVDNYVEAFDLLQPLADYVAVNVSSPNTPDLRKLQKGEHLADLLSGLTSANKALGRKPLLVKIAPDLNNDEIKSIVETCLASAIDGIIATNTTIARERLTSPGMIGLGPGGVSGKPLKKRSDEVISSVYSYSQGKLPIIGVGGVFTAQDAFDKIAAGASLVQAYTGFVYGGPTFAADVCLGLAGILAERGFKSVAEAVGTGVQLGS
jgi:dihydroorotate dehydrogenase